MKTLQTEQVEAFINDAIDKAGYKLVELEIKGGRKLSLKLTLDKEGGITLDECGSFNREIVRWLEEGEVDAGNFIIDVCSPGLDRELKSETSFVWALGKQVKVITREPVEGSNVVTGKLTARDSEGDIEIETRDGEKISVNGKNINKVKLIPKI